MTVYKGIYGYAVRSLSSDPSPLDEGQVWYNNTTYAFKLAALTTVGTWASGGALNTARIYGNSGGAGTQTAGLSFGGSPNDSAVTKLTTSESYNGTSWTNTPSLNTETSIAGGSGATNTAALCIAGAIPSTNNGNKTESYNGSSWTTLPATLNAGRYFLAGVGTQTSAIAFGGENPTGSPAGGVSSSESYAGSSWTNTPSLNTARRDIAGFGGSNSSAIAFGGAPGPSAATESYNGTAWTTVNSLNTARRGSRGGGTQTLGVGAGGGTVSGPSGATETWNGTSWTTNPNSMATARGSGSFAGTQTLGVYAGGSGPSTSGVATTEAWTGPGNPTTKTITTS